MSNKVIGIEYTLKDAKTGEQLDTNVGQAPLEFVSGKGQIIKGLEDKLVNMSANEEDRKKNVRFRTTSKNIWKNTMIS